MKKHSKNFKYLFLSQTLANTGDIIYIVGLITYIYMNTGKATASAALPVIITMAMFLSGFLSPYIYQFISKKQILLIFQFLKIVIMTCILMYIFFDNHSLVVLYALVFLNSLFDGFTNPIKGSMLPLIEGPDTITSANAKMGTVNNIIQVGAWALGGILVAVLGNLNLMILTLTLYVFSVLFILKLENIVANTHEKHTPTHAFKHMLKANKDSKWSLFINGTTILESLAHSVWIAAILLVYIKDFLHVDTFWFGLINATFFLGLIISGLCVNFADDFFQKHFKLFVVYMPILIALINFSFVMHHFIYLALIFSFAFGFFDEINDIVIGSRFQIDADDEELTNTYILNGMIYSFSFAISTLIISYLVDHFGISWAFIIAGISYLFVFVLSYYFIKKYHLDTHGTSQKSQVGQ